uniref:Major facilitator superfamily (MFS) profile domain-containing protein n=1 Tax=Romanomermis culicivorax TaxID=13658 RepID=A0A915JUR0_ROMCU
MFNNLNLGLTILCMTGEGKKITKNTSYPVSNSNTSSADDDNSCPACAAAALEDDQRPIAHFTNFSTVKRQNSSFRVDWSSDMQMLMMSALSWGRLVAPFAGLLTDRMDNSFLMETSFLVAGICNALFPLASSFSFGLVMALRVLLGVTDAVVQPCLNRFVAQWYSERTRTNAYGWATAGRQLGALIVFPISGFLCLQTQLLGGWPLVFYVSAFGCCAWTFTFYFFKIVYGQKPLVLHYFLIRSNVSDGTSKAQFRSAVTDCRQLNPRNRRQ